MPGIGGVTFGCGVFPVLLGSGIPGMPPAGILLALTSFGPGIPGVEPFIGTGLVEKPGGKSAALMFRITFPLTVLPLVVGDSAVVQDKFNDTIEKVKISR